MGEFYQMHDGQTISGQTVGTVHGQALLPALQLEQFSTGYLHPVYQLVQSNFPPILLPMDVRVISHCDIL